jgi:DNA-binding transcriptional LysR family regulator
VSGWRGIDEFLAIVRSGSFTAAGEELGVSKSYVSKTVQQLEDRLGVQLLVRTTRRLSLTDAGRQFHAECAELQDRLTAVERRVGLYSTKPFGRLRIGLSDIFGSDFMSTMLADFSIKHPEIEIEAIAYLDEGQVLQERFDLTIRYGKLPDSNLRARMFGYLSYCLCASRKYVDKHGWPETPEDLKGHACLTDLSATMRFNDNLEVKVTPRWRSNSGISLRSAVTKGLGIACLPVSVMRHGLADGSIVALDRDWAYYDREVWAVYSQGIMPASTRAFIDYLVRNTKRVKIRPDMAPLLVARA